MFMEERHRHIEKLLRESGKIAVAEITQAFGVSEESARRDLRILEGKGLCKRTHGGAILPQKVGIRPPANRNYAEMPIFPTYREIARTAAGEIGEGDTVYLCGGSFGYIMADFLPREFRYTLVCNSLDIAQKLREFDNMEVYLAGGRMRQSGSMVDSFATAFVKNLHFDLCFLTGAGVTAAFGLSNGTDETATFQRAVMENSRRKLLLMPGSKVGQNGFVKVCDAADFDRIITDWECLEEEIVALSELGPDVTRVEEPK